MAQRPPLPLLRFPSIPLLFLVMAWPWVIQADRVSSGLAFHLAGYGEGALRPAPGQASASFDLEPVFLSMSEVGEMDFGALDLDILSRSITHWAYGDWYGSRGKAGLDHALITVNKGAFLLPPGQIGGFNFGFGLDADWRYCDVLPRDARNEPQRASILGIGLAMRIKADLGRYARLAPALAYDAYVWPDDSDGILEGQGLRLACDIWLRAWPGRYTAALQPFWHWRELHLKRVGKNFKNAESGALGVKLGFGFLP